MCLFPISIKTKDSFGIYINQSVPCGKCIECLKDRQNSWKIRLCEEARDHKYVYFFTLTYRDDVVPHTFIDGLQVNQVCKKHIQLWIKRNRIYFERYFGFTDLDFKYFICSEYGPNTGRPHYHGIIFTEVSPIFITYMFTHWQKLYGFTNFSLVNGLSNYKTSMSSVGNYVAKYCLKPKQLSTPAEIRVNDFITKGLIEPTFYLMSKGIGIGYIRRMKRWHIPHIKDPRLKVKVVVDRSVYHDGPFCYKLPRFFRDRLYRMKFPCDVRIWNKNKRCYENKVVKRYQSKNPLSLQMQVEIRNRLLAEYDKLCTELRFKYPYKSDTEIYLLATRADKDSKMARFQDTFSKMSRFYNSQRFSSLKL